MKQKNINFKYFRQQVCRDCSPTFTVAYRFNGSDPSPAGCSLAPCPRLREKKNNKKGCICMHEDTTIHIISIAPISRAWRRVA